MIREYKIFRLSFLSPLHISKGKSDDYGESDQILRSDTLKSALFVCARKIFGAELIADDDTFFRRFRITSAYPFFGRELFFPKPMLPLQPFDPKEISEEKQAKSHKKIEFLGQSYFEDLIGPGTKVIRKSHLISGGRFVSESEEVMRLKSEPLLASEVQQRVTISADFDEDPIPYYVDRIFFNRNAGLWFAFEGDDEMSKIIERSLVLLGDEGIGTDRSVGNGQFEASRSTLLLNVPENTRFRVLLSLFCPKKNELENMISSSQYGLVKRGGYIASPDKTEHSSLRKKSIHMFTEGSVFEVEHELEGKIANLKPDYNGLDQNVWRDGLAFTIPTRKPLK
jgi:CRISPR-associated protein Csm4